MKTSAKLTIASFALLVPCALAAQTYKCTDANGKITYSGKKCTDLGLKAAGEVKDQIQTAPAYRPAPATTGARTSEGTRTSEGARRSPPASAPAAQAPAPEPAAAAESDDPARRCFTVKTAKGNATRCNDTPPDADAPPSNP
jgi:hypothetical protein